MFDREQSDCARTNTVARLSQTHALFFFFRSDCPYCHQFAPLLARVRGQVRAARSFRSAWTAGRSARVSRIPRVDNGIARALDVRQVPALFLAEPRGGKIAPIGYGVLSESELLERMQVVTQPDADKLVPSTTQYVRDHFAPYRRLP